MNALRKLAPGVGGLALTDMALPTAGPGQVVLDILGAGVCGTDLHIEAGEFPCAPPVTLGHEICGRVVEVGEEVANHWTGERVVVETFFATCGVCRWCRDGRPNLCPERRSLGVHVDGGFAARAVVPERNLHPVPDWVSDHAAALFEPLACVCQAMLGPSCIEPGDNLLVFGPGPVGLLAAQVARTCGARVTVVGRPGVDDARLEHAERLGLASGLVEELRDSTDVDVAIECSGSAQAAATALQLLRRAGTLVQLGIFGRDVALPLDLLLYKELRYRSGFASTPRAWRDAVRLVTERAVDLEQLVTVAVPLAAWPEVFSRLRAQDAMKVVFDPRID
ncbi:MAG TPA: alcohol dehydrogenase catalytic domain-containing protein [Gaiellaceae bacterium]|jgi:L-iditol 2-dehydrogenase|nr:alcohol dehydrogenase catalytic domain-containing protein [Gaiellaceae bacterium]